MSTETNPEQAPAPVWDFEASFLSVDTVDEPQFIELFAAAGKRKTSTAATIVEVPKYRDAKVLFIDIDKGATVLANNPAVKAKIADGSFRIIQINRDDAGDPATGRPPAFGQLTMLLGYKDPVTGGWVQGQAFQRDYDIVILDTLDVAQEVAKDWFLANTFTDDGTKLNTMAGWGRIGDWTLGVAWALKNSTALGIALVHSKEESEGGAFKIKPALAGGAKDKLGGIPDLVAHLDFITDEGQDGATHLVASIGESGITETKNRWMLPPKLIDFTLPQLYELIEQRRAETDKQIAIKA